MNDDNKTGRKRSSVSTMQMFSEAMRDLLPYSHLPYQMASSILIMFGIGYGLDAWTDNSPLFTVIFSTLGVVLGLYVFIKCSLNCWQ